MYAILCADIIYGMQDVSAASWSPDGKRMALGHDFGSLELVNLKTDEVIVLGMHKEEIRSVRWSPDGTRLLTGSVDNSVRIWDTESNECLFEISEDLRYVESVRWSPDGTAFAAASYSCEACSHAVIMWDAVTFEKIASMPQHPEPITSIAWSPDGEHIVSVDVASIMIVWKFKEDAFGFTSTIVQSHCWKHHPTTVAWSPDGKTIATGSTDGTVMLWDAEYQRHTDTLEGHAAKIVEVSWSDEGTLGSASEIDARIWDIRANECVKCRAAGKPIVSITWVGDRLAAISEDESHLILSNQPTEVQQEAFAQAITDISDRDVHDTLVNFYT